MILVDTSVWLRHFRAGDPHLCELLLNDGVATHSIVLGELALMQRRVPRTPSLVEAVGRLPRARQAEDAELLALSADSRLDGLALGWVELNLLASALSSGCLLWTEDPELREAARRLGLLYEPR